VLVKQGFIPAPFKGKLPQTSEIPRRRFGKVYGSIKNPVISGIKRAAVTQV